MRISAFALLLLAPAAKGDTPHVEARLRGERVTVAVFFDDDTPAAGAILVVRSKAKRAVATGRTDNRGEWTFSCPAPGDYTISAATPGNSIIVPMMIPTAAALRGLAPTEDTIVTGGPNRTEVVRLPWLRPALAAGAALTIIAVFVIARRRPAIPMRFDA